MIWSHCNKAVNYLHDAIPVVAGGNLEECEEGHPKVFKGGVSAHSFTGVVSVTHWEKTWWEKKEGRRERKGLEGETLVTSNFYEGYLRIATLNWFLWSKLLQKKKSLLRCIFVLASVHAAELEINQILQTKFTQRKKGLVHTDLQTNTFTPLCLHQSHNGKRHRAKTYTA